MKEVLKKIYIGTFIFFLLIVLTYISDITNIPENIILFEGESLNLKTVLGVDVKTTFSSNPNIEKIENNKTVTVSANAESNTNNTGKLKLDVSLLGFKLKEINVDIIENAEVVPLGNLIGVKLYTNGVLVVGMSEITGDNMERYKPYEGSGIAKGDIIVEIDEKLVTCTSDLTECINESKGNEMQVTYIRNGNVENTNMKAIKSNDNGYKVGLWVRDTAAGVGTATFYDPNTKRFASLGHGIIDADTEELIEISSGEIVNANILSIIKGKEGNPGKIQGSIEGKQTIGTIYKNTGYGIYGYLTNINSLSVRNFKTIPVALRSEINTRKSKYGMYT